jgi:type II secretory pathway pseudopilin PulG
MRRTVLGRKYAQKRAGISLLEVLIALVMFTVAVTAYAGAVASTSQSSTERRASSLAAAAARDMIERMRATPAHERFAAFNTNPADDPGGAGTAPGGAFAVEGLTAMPGDADGFVGAVEFALLEGELREDATDARLGLPRDLNGDTLIDSNSRANDYVILPVRIRVEHQVRGDRRVFELHTELVDWDGAGP